MKEISLQNKAWMTPKELEAGYGITEGVQYKLRMNKNYEVSACNNPIPFVRWVKGCFIIKLILKIGFYLNARGLLICRSLEYL